MNETEYLRKQAEDAREAMSKALGGLLSDSANLANPKRWTRSHPWASLIAAAAGGFLLTSSMPPKKEPATEESKLLRKVKDYVHGVVAAAKGEALKAGAAAHEAAENAEANVKRDVAGPASLASTFLKEAFHFARPIVSTILASQFARAKADSEQHNGHAETAASGSDSGQHS